MHSSFKVTPNCCIYKSCTKCSVNLKSISNIQSEIDTLTNLGLKWTKIFYKFYNFCNDKFILITIWIQTEWTKAGARLKPSPVQPVHPLLNLMCRCASGRVQLLDLVLVTRLSSLASRTLDLVGVIATHTTRTAVSFHSFASGSNLKNFILTWSKTEKVSFQLNWNANKIIT